MDSHEGGPPLSIGYLSPGWPLEGFANGIVSYIADMADQLPRMGHRVTILAHHTAVGELDAGVYDVQEFHSARGLARRIMDNLGYRLAPRWMNRFRFSQSVVATLRRAIAERDIQVVEVEESFGIATWLQRALAIPVCVRLHGPWFLNGPAEGVPEDAAFRQRVSAEGRAIAEAVALTSSSFDVLERTRAYYGLALEQAEVIYPPTTPVPAADRWRPEGCNPKEILFIGRFDRHKGGDLIVEAFGRVRQAIPDARLCFAGPDRGFVDDGGRRWALEEFVADRLPGAMESGHVALLGQQPFSALPPLRRRAAITVVCSRYENAPRALIEAMALGCPIVAARVGGIPEIIRDGVDGLLHRGGDPDDLAAKIVALLGDPAHAIKLGRHAAARCDEEFHPVAIASRTVDFYHRVLRTATTTRTE
ncbi:MAG: glycosyltransferase family 4 protein [Isosphaeraceae bacterium]